MSDIDTAEIKLRSESQHKTDTHDLHGKPQHCVSLLLSVSVFLLSFSSSSSLFFSQVLYLYVLLSHTISATHRDYHIIYISKKFKT